MSLVYGRRSNGRDIKPDRSSARMFWNCESRTSNRRAKSGAYCKYRDESDGKRQKMKIVQLTPGAGGMYCGNCFRDNALVAEWRKMGHDAVMASLYLPMTLDEEDQSQGVPVFFAGTNVYLSQIFPLFGKAPDWLRSWLASPALLKWAGSRAGKTRPDQLGDLTLSMIHGELVNQARELDDLVTWLKNDQKPEVVCLSNALLVGMVRRIRNEVG